MTSKRGWLMAIVIAVMPAIVAVTIYFTIGRFETRYELVGPPKPEAPPDLAKLRPAFSAGLQALQQKDGPAAVRHFSSFNCGQRDVEEYRLYFLANGYQLAGSPRSVRTTLARLWSRTPRLVYWSDAAFTLGALYNAAGDWNHASAVYRAIATRSDQSPVSANARWQYLNTRFAAGDVAAVLSTARDIAVKNPRAPQAGDAIAILRSLTLQKPTDPIKLTSPQRLERAVSLLRDGDPQNALAELNTFDTARAFAEFRLPIQLNKGLALNQLHRYEESNKLLEPLASGPYKIAIPAMYTASKNYHLLALAINPIVNKTIIVRQRVGTIRVPAKGKKKPVLRPRFANVKKTIQLVDLAKKARKEEYERLAPERLKDLLSLPLANEVRIEVLNTLIATAEAKNDDDFEQKLILNLALLDPSQEAGLQHFWGKAWAAYVRTDYNGAAKLFVFIRDIYRNPNVKRQADYWRARAIERLGKQEEAAAIYRSLAAAPYADLYVVYSQAHGAPHQDPPISPLKEQRPDWPEIAENGMPDELRLAYELTALNDARDARLEIQKNLKRSNQPFADALLADLYNSTGDMLLMMRSARRAFPQLATVEQDSVPPYFLRMYYPRKYEEAIMKYARQNNLDPYLIMGLVHQESTFNPLARSPVGAVGLMQLMPPTAKELARRLNSSANVENPEVNIRLGTFYFRQLVDMFGGVVQLAVASYNAGMGNVMRWRRAAPRKPLDEFIESMPFAETRNYVKRVTMLSASYRRLTR
ncbi:MAG TPA: lytic transglycosylase domain-containing protein [Thermoanaerobaculia bacterium]